jgi:plasmid maintenance system killer protein
MTQTWGPEFRGEEKYAYACSGYACVARFAYIERPALRKLKQLDLARTIEDLRAPPTNRPE